jgi:hypothetical protein
MGKITSCYDSRERYMLLRVIGFLFVLIGSVLLVLGGYLLVLGIQTLAAEPSGGPPLGGGPFVVREVGSRSSIAGLSGTLYLAWSCAALISGLQSIVVGLLLRLLIHLEENTRASAIALDKLRQSLEPKSTVGEPFFVADKLPQIVEGKPEGTEPFFLS